MHECTGAETRQVRPEGAEVTTYDVTREPPSRAGAVHTTLAERTRGVATTCVGAVGAVTEEAAKPLSTNEFEPAPPV